jgi:NtrC-family two-component system response regulator AlgB
MEPQPLHILIVDDEANIRKTLSVFCETQGHKCTCAATAQDAIKTAEEIIFDLAFLDLRLGTESGLDYLPALLSANPRLKIVIITAYATIDSAVKAMQSGAVDYLPKPFVPEQLSAIFQRILTMKNMESRIQTMQDELGRLQIDTSFSSKSSAMQKAYELARQVAPSDASILLEGPSGSGKTVLARMIHQWSQRSNRPFGVISCPTLSHELFESELFGHVRGAFTGAVKDTSGKVAYCEGGTLFLDEVGDLPLVTQPKLLRFVQDREYVRVGDHITRKANVRLITATNSDLQAALKDNIFREDLFFRLSVIVIKLPALVDRKDDIITLAESMLSFFSAQNHKTFSGFNQSVIKALQDYSWPGNLRELRNVIERMAILCNKAIIGAEWLPDSMAGHNDTIRLGDTVSLSALERAHIQKVLLYARSIQEAADILGIDQATLWRKRKQFGLN